MSNIYDINGNIAYNASHADFADNMELDYEFDETSDANYTVIRVFQTKRDGTKQYPFVRVPNEKYISAQGRTNALTLAREEGWLLTINAGIGTGANLPIDGIAIENGVVKHDSPATYYTGAEPITIDENGTLASTDADPSGATLVSQGIVSAILGFCPIIVDYEPVSFPSVGHTTHFTQNAQRQIIGQFGNGDYAIITCEGRDYDHSDGWTLAEAQVICQKLGLKFAYNLDGGGSTETVIGKKQINTIYENETGRIVPSFIVFNGTDTYGIPNE